MPINSVSLITGALSFSAALAWNKAINDSLYSVTKKAPSSVIQAIVITIIIIIVVFLINFCINYYTKLTNTQLKPSLKKIGGNNNAKVKLWNL